MEQQYYPIPDAPEYNPEIRVIQDNDRVRASTVVNPVLEQMIENIHANHLTAQQGKALAEKAIPTAEKGVPGGVATLDAQGKVPQEQLPPMEFDEEGSARKVQAALDSHKADTGNPHKITAQMIGADIQGSAEAVKAEVEAHTQNGDAHVTKEKQTFWNDGVDKAEQALVEAQAANGRRYTTLVIGAAANGHTERDADYICSGTSDQMVIHKAMQALPEGGGRILLLEGDYYFDAQIKLDKANTVVEGVGNGTVLHKMCSGEGVLLSGAASSLRNLAVDGNKSAYSATSNNGGVYISGKYALVSGVSVTKAGGIGIRLAGEGTKAEHCVCEENGNDGIQFHTTSQTSLAIGNICSKNSTYGIRTYGKNDVAVGNIISGNTSGIINEASGSSNFQKFGNSTGA